MARSFTDFVGKSGAIAAVRLGQNGGVLED